MADDVVRETGHAPSFYGVVVPECLCPTCRIQAALVDAVRSNGAGVVSDPRSKIDPLATVLGGILSMFPEAEADKAIDKLKEGVKAMREIRETGQRNAEAMAQEPAGHA